MEHTPESLARLKRYVKSLRIASADEEEKIFRNCTTLGNFMRQELRPEMEYIASTHSMLALLTTTDAAFITAFLTGLGLGMDFMEHDLLESMVREEES